jgi:hypothetical protein
MLSMPTYRVATYNGVLSSTLQTSKERKLNTVLVVHMTHLLVLYLTVPQFDC